MGSGLSILDGLEKVGIIGLMALAIVGAIRGWWVPGHVYRKASSDRDRMQRERDEQTEIASESVKALGIMTEYFRGKRKRGGRQ